MRDHRAYSERREWQAPEGYGIDVEQPIAGFFKVKLGRDTVLRAVHLTYGPPLDPVTGEVMDRSWRWMAYLDDGHLAPFDDIWPACARDPIDEAEWKRCKARVAWAREHAPDSAYAERGVKIDLLSRATPLPF